MMRTEWSEPAVVPAGHPCLAGHFPGQPVVPAVLLIDLAVGAIRARFPALQLTAIASAKFLRPVLPEAALQLQLSIDPASGAARFRCLLGTGEAAVGELRFGASR